MKVDSFYKFNSQISKLNTHALDMAAWHLSKQILNRCLPKYFQKHEIVSGTSARAYTPNEVILSLTTFPARIYSVPLVLETLFRQTVKADRIILWLAEEQFPNKDADRILHKYVDLGLEIKYCDDLRSHKKYYYSIKENPESIVITCDDDILYSETMLERLLKTAKEYPGMIVCERAHEITFENGIVKKYNDWNYRARGTQGPSLLLCPTGGAGCLYPPNSLSPNIFDKDILKEICLYADDIWLKCMSYLARTPVIITRLNGPEIIDTCGTNQNGLARINVEQKLNDKQFIDVTNYYDIKWCES